MKIKNISALAATLMMPLLALAAPGAYGGGIPWTLIGFQAANVIIVIAGLIFFLKKPVGEFFSQRREVYAEAAKKAMQAREAAELRNRDIKERLQKLENTEKETIEKSKVEAAQLEQKIIADANEIAGRVERDVQRMVRAELDKAKTLLRNEIIDESFSAAEVALKAKINESEQKRLQGEFVNKIQVARS